MLEKRFQRATSYVKEALEVGTVTVNLHNQIWKCVFLIISTNSTYDTLQVMITEEHRSNVYVMQPRNTQ